MSLADRFVPLAGKKWLAPAVLILLIAIHELVYLSVVPPWQGPDEPRHFEYIALIAGEIAPDEPAALELQSRIIRSMEAHDFWTYGYAIEEYDPVSPPQVLDDIWPGHAHETHQPPLYYQIAGGIVRLSGTTDIDTQLLIVRILSTILGISVVLLAWSTAHTLFPQQAGLSFLIGLFIALLPMHTFMNTVANNDNLASLLVAVVLFLSARMIRFGVRWPELIGGIIAATLAITTKRTGIIAPAILVIAILAGYTDHIAGLFRRRSTKRVAIAGAAILLLAVIAILVFGTYAQRLIADLWKGFLHLPPDVLEHLMDGSYGEALVQTPYLYYSRVMFESFWARFGWLNVCLPETWYWVLVALCAVAGVGLASLLLSPRRHSAGMESYQRRAVIAFTVTAILNYALILGKEVLFLSYQTGVTPQGRYMFPVVISLATLLILGLREITPARWRMPAAYFGSIILALFGAICILGYVVPYYSS